MWRSLSVLDGGPHLFLDADVLEFPAHYVSGLLGPLLEFAEIDFVKAFYRRPFRQGEVLVAHGGGRVNHLLARPTLAIFYRRWPVCASRLPARSPRGAPCSAPPLCGGLRGEIAMLLDVYRQVGLEGMAQVDLDTHNNATSPCSS